MSAAGRVFKSLNRVAFNRGVFINDVRTALRLNSVRSLTLSCQRPARSNKSTDNGEVNHEPIKFSTSKASHRTWKVDRTMGSHHERNGSKVLPLSLIGVCFLLWCVFRGETEVDGQLEKKLYEHLPGLLPDEEEQGEDKPS
ncbi:ubiquinol-cytochrome-c reductase complex assembly factor 4 [Scomber scombrus]|uniref:ubiquinol-cytochrome-c reductase complex assembly factor 4 n=1 Tax=Scomber scombrus TaxID=13677 RepID=UPI002DD7F33C|nr:ubiquinol-cytochrome-c reductase complex assembly factor 4 [Scomber scombrus]